MQAKLVLVGAVVTMSTLIAGVGMVVNQTTTKIVLTTMAYLVATTASAPAVTPWTERLGWLWS